MKHKLLKVLLLPFNYHCLLQCSLHSQSIIFAFLSWRKRDNYVSTPSCAKCGKNLCHRQRESSWFFFSHPVFVEMRNWATDLGRSRAKRVRPCSAHVRICVQWRSYHLCLHSEVAILVCGNQKLLHSSCHVMPPIKMFPNLLLLARCSLAIPSRIPLWDSSPIVWLFFSSSNNWWLHFSIFCDHWPPFCQSIAELKMNAKYSYAVSELTPAAAKCPTLLMKLCSTLETNAQLPS